MHQIECAAEHQSGQAEGKEEISSPCDRQLQLVGAQAGRVEGGAVARGDDRRIAHSAG